MTRGPYHTAKHELIMEEFAFLRPWGLTRQQIADKLGVERDSLVQHLRRAAVAGDPRSDWEPRVDVCTGTDQSIRNQRERARGWVA